MFHHAFTMHERSELPEPDADALRHSARLSALIRERISAAGGWIDFAEYMELALYAPGLGYYSAGAQKLGPAGDFVTAPEVSALFSRCLARSLAPTVGQTADATVLELGAGSGAMAADLLRTLARDDALPERYLILEVSADLRQRQRETLTARVPELATRVEWLDALPAPFDGVIVANEVVDALPVSRFRICAAATQQPRVQAVGVGIDASGFCWSDRPAGESLRNCVAEIEATLGAVLPVGFTSEVSIGLAGLIGSLVDSLRNGRCILVDYGLVRGELYRLDRSSGTLRCHYRHHAHDDPFRYPGLQDITAWVDFTTIAVAAVAAGARVDAFATQAHFLIGAGIEHEFAAANAAATRRDSAGLALSQQMQMLLMPGQMGERFKVMQLACGESVAGPAPELVSGGGDLRDRL